MVFYASWILLTSLSIPIVGLPTGELQYGLLRRYLPRMSAWVLATAGGRLLGIW